MNPPVVASIGNTYLDETLFIPRLPIPDLKITVSKAITSLGGSATNFAVAFHKLNNQCDLYSTISNDLIGQKVFEQLRQIGLSVNTLEQIDGIQGRTLVLLTPDGESSKLGLPGVSTRSSIRSVKRIELTKYDHVHLASPEYDALKLLKHKIKKTEKKPTISIDIGAKLLEHKKEDVVKALDVADLVFMNRLAYRSLYGLAPPEVASDFSDKIVVITMGDEGVFYSNKEDKQLFNAIKVKPADTTGAGDVLAAYTVYYFLKGDPKRGVELGNIAASLKIQHYGATNGIPSLTEVLEWEKMHL